LAIGGIGLYLATPTLFVPLQTGKKLPILFSPFGYPAIIHFWKKYLRLNFRHNRSKNLKII
jgi:hypothetical protein